MANDNVVEMPSSHTLVVTARQASLLMAGLAILRKVIQDDAMELVLGPNTNTREQIDRLYAQIKGSVGRTG